MSKSLPDCGKRWPEEDRKILIQSNLSWVTIYLKTWYCSVGYSALAFEGTGFLPLAHKLNTNWNIHWRAYLPEQQMQTFNNLRDNYYLNYKFTTDDSQHYMCCLIVHLFTAQLCVFEEFENWMLSIPCISVMDRIWKNWWHCRNKDFISIALRNVCDENIVGSPVSCKDGKSQ